MNFKIQLLAVAAAMLLASSVDAAPAKLAKKARKNISAIVPETELRHTRIVGAEVEPIAEVNNFAGPVSALQSALDYANSRFTDEGIQERGYVVKDSYKTDHNGITHVYLRQVVNGLEVFNADMNVNVMEDGSILSAADNFFAGSAPSFFTRQSRLSPLQALEHFGKFIGEETVTKNFFGSTNVEEVQIDENAALIRNVPYAESDVPAKLVYVQANGELKLGWELTVEMSENWFSTVVDATSGEVISVNDWVSQAVPTYRVLPFGVEDPTEGKLELVTKTFESGASPLGWHDDGKTKYTDTRGNNIDARSPSGSTSRRPNGGADLQFLDTADFTQDAKTYYLAATTNMFHVANRFHDLTYQLGFNEVAGNFQTDNFGKGGKGNDAVIANAQDPSGTNNANFATPADGSPGKMNMYIWTQTKPTRDGDFQAGVVIHEYSHGLSTRLTGGPANSNCLPSGESGGMGEGWGDALSTVLRQREEYTRSKSFPLGAYVYGNVNGIRKYPYSTDLKVDPETYGYLKKSGYSEVHTIGEVWAGILNEVYWNLREAKGYQADLFKIDIKTEAERAKAKGNVIFLLDVVDAMKLQPCKPSFVDARDAILAADKANFNSANACLLWKGFAKRGLGVKAKSGGTEDFSVPAECN